MESDHVTTQGSYTEESEAWWRSRLEAIWLFSSGLMSKPIG